MRLGMRLPGKDAADAASEGDPRDGMSAEVIDLASRQSYPVVANRRGRSDTVGLLIGVGIVGLLGAVTLWSMDTARNADNAVAPASTIAGESVPVTAVEDLAPPPQPDDPPFDATPDPVIRPDPGPAPILSRPPAIQVGPVTNPYASPTMIYDGTRARTGGIAAATAAVGEAASAPTQVPISGAGGSAGEFASRIGGVGGSTASAVSTFDPRTTVTQGTLIPAILETAIDTDVPGFVRAVVSQDVRSYDGSRVLVPRSSRLIGQYQSGLQAGQRRAYVVWTRLIRPDGVSVDIASPATGFDGSGGLPGDVDNHFFRRFGSAILLSVIGGLSTIASGGGGVILGGGSTAASTALAQDGQVGPTVRVRQGEPIRVFTARDLDFSRVAN